MAAVLDLAVDVETDLLLRPSDADVLGGEVCQVGDHADGVGEEGVEETDEDVLVGLAGEQAFEPEVCQRVDEGVVE